MKNLFKKIALALTFALSIMFVNPIIEVKAYTSNNFELNEQIEIPNLILSEAEIKLANDYIQSQLDNGNIAIMPRSVAALAGTFLIPGIGQVAITTAGVIIVGGAVVTAGSWLGQKVTSWVKTYKFNKSAEKTLKKIGKDNNKIHHIMNPKHNWNKFFNNPKWSNVAPIITKVLKEGTERLERGNIYVRRLYYQGKTVEVRFIKDSNGFIQAISTAWTK